MGQGGATNAGNSEYLAQGVFELIQGNNNLKKAAEDFLKDQNDSLKNLDLADQEKIMELLGGDKGAGFLKAISKSLSEEEKFKKLAEQIGKDSVMMEKLETLGNQLLVQGIIGGAAFTTLTGALTGSLVIGGMAGALMGGGIALAGFVALVAIAAIGYAIYQHRGEIKEGALDAGKAIKSFVKNVIDKIPRVEIQEREKNFYKLHQELSQLALQTGTEGDEIKNIQNKAKVIKMLQNEEQRLAIKELVKEEVIKDFSEEDMSRLVKKGNSTHEKEDMEELKNLMEKFQPAIMAIGSDIKEVEQKIDEKVKEMKPSPELNSTSTNPAKESDKGVTSN